MRFQFPEADCWSDPAWTAPLYGFAAALAGRQGVMSDRFFDPHDFMIMVRLVRGPRPSIVLYKHIYTRCYLNLDNAGHAYRYFAPRDPLSDRCGQYRLLKTPRAAVDGLGLWQLPQMKPGLESYGPGPEWDHIWVPEDQDAEDLVAGGFGRP